MTVSRADSLRNMPPQLIAVLTLYPTSAGGRESPAQPGWGCPCFASKSHEVDGYDGWPLLEDTPLTPGGRRRVGFVFLSGKTAADALSAAGTFYLWEGRFVGEATVVG